MSRRRPGAHHPRLLPDAAPQGVDGGPEPVPGLDPGSRHDGKAIVPLVSPILTPMRPAPAMTTGQFATVLRLCACHRLITQRDVPTCLRFAVSNKPSTEPGQLQSCVVRVLAWLAIAAAFSSVPPFLRYAVMPVARKV